MGILNVFKKQPGELDVLPGADAGAPPQKPEKDEEKPSSLKASDGKRLLFFYGDECPHCHSLMPRIEEVEKQLGVKFERFEVWHDQKNAELLKQYDKGHCGGVPFLYNTAAKEWICGSVETDKVHAFATKG